jgi:hypothetical protein
MIPTPPTPHQAVVFTAKRRSTLSLTFWPSALRVTE